MLKEEKGLREHLAYDKGNHPCHLPRLKGTDARVIDGSTPRCCSRLIAALVKSVREDEQNRVLEICRSHAAIAGDPKKHSLSRGVIMACTSIAENVREGGSTCIPAIRRGRKG